MTHPWRPKPVPTMSVVRAVRAVTVVRVPIVPAVALPAVALVPMPHRSMAVTSLLVQVAMPNPPLSAFAQSPRQLQQLTVNKE